MQKGAGQWPPPHPLTNPHHFHLPKWDNDDDSTDMMMTMSGKGMMKSPVQTAEGSTRLRCSAEKLSRVQASENVKQHAYMSGETTFPLPPPG